MASGQVSTGQYTVILFFDFVTPKQTGLNISPNDRWSYGDSMKFSLLANDQPKVRCHSDEATTNRRISQYFGVLKSSTNEKMTVVERNSIVFQKLAFNHF
jgi:hypothetical protein